MPARIRAELLARHDAEVGEGPRWLPGERAISWVDITAGRWHRTSLDGSADRVIATDGMLGAIAPGLDCWVAADERGFAYRRDDGSLLERIEVLGADVRMNDAACDPRGRLWAGSTEYAFTPGRGALHRLDPDGALTTVLEGISQPNGLGWSPDGSRFHLVDTVERVLWDFAFDLDDGVPHARRPLVEWPAGSIPDGLAVDADGGIWVAMWGEGVVRRYTPTGALDAEVAVPVSQTTSCAFLPGGRLVVTTARLYLDEAELAAQPLAGSLFVADAGVEGAPVASFAGGPRSA